MDTQNLVRWISCAWIVSHRVVLSILNALSIQYIYSGYNYNILQAVPAVYNEIACIKLKFIIPHQNKFFVWDNVLDSVRSFVRLDWYVKKRSPKLFQNLYTFYRLYSDWSLQVLSNLNIK